MHDAPWKPCAACRGEVAPLSESEIAQRAADLGGGWTVIQGRHIEKQYRFADFRQALAFTNRVGELAEAEGHHPDIHLTWGSVRVVFWTHAVNGLTGTDFELASKADRLST